jgi:hypothetical protein
MMQPLLEILPKRGFDIGRDFHGRFVAAVGPMQRHRRHPFAGGEFETYVGTGRIHLGVHARELASISVG